MRKFISVTLIMALITALLTGCGDKLYTDGDANGYTIINDVDGAAFSIVTNIVRNATAVTNISENMNFEIDQTYLYKNGQDQYLLFNISSVVVAVQKGTSFGVSGEADKAESIKSNNLLGIWFNIPTKKLEYTDNTADNVYKMMATVNAEVSITSEVFNDFAGKLVVISDGTDEWSLFVGTSGTDYEALDNDTKDVISYIAASFQRSDYAPEEYTPAVTVGGAEESSEDISAPEAVEEISVVSEPEDKGEEVTEESVEESSAASEDTSKEYQVEEIEIELIEESTEDEPQKEEAELEVVEEVIEEVTEPEETKLGAETEDSDRLSAMQEAIKRGDSIELNNQKAFPKDDDTVYKSTIYDMLRLRNWGYADILTGKNNVHAVSAKISDLITGANAADIIKNASISGDIPYEYFDAPAGCTWHMVRVILTSENAEYLQALDVKIVGADGNKLNFRGIKYPSRTYNIELSNTEKYVYYAVPNGCSEYVLEIGDGTVDNALNSAYFLISSGEF